MFAYIFLHTYTLHAHRIRIHLNSFGLCKTMYKHPPSRKTLKNKPIEPHNHFTKNTNKSSPIFRKTKKPVQPLKIKTKNPAPKGSRGKMNLSPTVKSSYLFPFALLCVLHNIWQLATSVAPPLLHAVTWSASISLKSQILV